MNTRTSQIETPVAHARALFLGVLEGWASDCLDLRAKGLDRPSRRSGSGVGGRTSCVIKAAKPVAIKASGG